MFRNAGKLPARILSFPILRTLHVWFDLTISVYNKSQLTAKTKEPQVSISIHLVFLDYIILQDSDYITSYIPLVSYPLFKKKTYLPYHGCERKV